MAFAVETANAETPPLARGRPEWKQYEPREVLKHPRLRGEDRSEWLAQRRTGRNTPACAGKTAIEPFGRRRRSKHPCLRGEDEITSGIYLANLETPPLARGRLRLQGHSKLQQGNTPACAGKTAYDENDPWEFLETPPLTRGRQAPPKTAREACRKHPRLRGEDLPFGMGESPNRRNTPAYAGKTAPLL